MIAATGLNTANGAANYVVRQHPAERADSGHVRQRRLHRRPDLPRDERHFCTPATTDGPPRLDKPLGLDGEAAGLLGPRGVLFAVLAAARRTGRPRQGHDTVDEDQRQLPAEHDDGKQDGPDRRELHDEPARPELHRPAYLRTPSNPRGARPRPARASGGARAARDLRPPVRARRRELSLEGDVRGRDRRARRWIRPPSAGTAEPARPALDDPTDAPEPPEDSRRTTRRTVTTSGTSSA